MYYLDLANSIVGLAFALVGTVGGVIAVIPTFRHKAVKQITQSVLAGRSEALKGDPPRWP